LVAKVQDRGAADSSGGSGDENGLGHRLNIADDSDLICRDSAPLVFAGLAGPGLYQLQVTVPLTAPNGANPVTCTYKGSTTPAGDAIVQQ
jgi:hypothetical protein